MKVYTETVNTLGATEVNATLDPSELDIPEAFIKEAEHTGEAHSENETRSLFVVEVDPPRWCVVIEWGDGTVGTNGPYVTKSLAVVGAMRVAKQIHKENCEVAEDHEDEPPLVQDPDGGAWRIGADWDDQIDVYIQEMGRPA